MKVIVNHRTLSIVEEIKARLQAIHGIRILKKFQMLMNLNKLLNLCQLILLKYTKQNSHFLKLWK
jgi:hypothetical protein